MNRKDLYIGPLHIIIRGYNDDPQYGTLLWGSSDKTLDIWFHKTLITFRRANQW